MEPERYVKMKQQQQPQPQPQQPQQPQRQQQQQPTLSQLQCQRRVSPYKPALKEKPILCSRRCIRAQVLCNMFTGMLSLKSMALYPLSLQDEKRDVS